MLPHLQTMKGVLKIIFGIFTVNFGIFVMNFRTCIASAFAL